MPVTQDGSQLANMEIGDELCGERERRSSRYWSKSSRITDRLVMRQVVVKSLPVGKHNNDWAVVVPVGSCMLACAQAFSCDFCSFVNALHECANQIAEAVDFSYFVKVQY